MPGCSCPANGKVPSAPRFPKCCYASVGTIAAVAKARYKAAKRTHEESPMAEMKARELPQVERPLSPHLQIYSPLINMVMSIIHRITGGALYFGTLLLAWWLTRVPDRLSPP